MTPNFQFETTPLDGLVVIRRKPRKDERGEFERLFCVSELSDFGIDFSVKQINRSFTKQQGTVRGLHFQRSPRAEGKLITCLAGSVLDVAVDLRRNSSTFGQWYGVELREDNNTSIYIPPGFAHGFQTLTCNCELLYLHSEFYSNQLEGGVHHHDPQLAIDWPLDVAQISERDAALPFIDFSFEGIEV